MKKKKVVKKIIRGHEVKVNEKPKPGEVLFIPTKKGEVVSLPKDVRPSDVAKITISRGRIVDFRPAIPVEKVRNTAKDRTFRRGMR